jgi:hypothetical protein
MNKKKKDLLPFNKSKNFTLSLKLNMSHALFLGPGRVATAYILFSGAPFVLGGHISPKLRAGKYSANQTMI